MVSTASESHAAFLARECLRRRYCPAHVRLLFVGESPPASGRFFYQCDSGLYRAMLDAFRAIDESINDQEFLVRFQSAGCYLIDTCPHPVDQLDPPTRRAACIKSEPLLSKAISEHRPNMMATVVRSIRDNAVRAALRAGWSGEVLDLPYPGRWARHRTAFLDSLIPQLKRLGISRAR